jgi:hypothetical protein
VKMSGEVEAMRLIKAARSFVRKRLTSTTAEEEVRAGLTDWNLYYTPVVPLVQRAGIEVKKPRPIDTNTVGWMTDYLPAWIDVPERIEEVHGHVAPAKRCPPEREASLLRKVCQYALLDCMRHCIGLESSRVVVLFRVIPAVSDSLSHFEMGGEKVPTAFFTDTAMHRRAVGPK